MKTVLEQLDITSGPLVAIIPQSILAKYAPKHRAGDERPVQYKQKWRAPKDPEEL